MKNKSILQCRCSYCTTKKTQSTEYLIKSGSYHYIQVSLMDIPQTLHQLISGSLMFHEIHSDLLNSTSSSTALNFRQHCGQDTKYQHYGLALTLGSPGEEQALSTSTLMALMSMAELWCWVVECRRLMLTMLVFSRFSSRLPKGNK